MPTLERIVGFLEEEWRLLFTVRPSDRPWQMPIAAAMASGLPLFVGVWFGHLDYGLVSSLGGQVFLHLPPTPLHHRMAGLMALAFTMTACYALGAIAHHLPLATVPLVFVLTTLVTMLCRFYRVAPPGPLFFVMAAVIAVYTPMPVPEIPRMVGLLAMGTILATVIAFLYSLHTLRNRPAEPIPAPDDGFDHVILEPLIIGASVGVAMAIALGLQMDRAYWVPISCLAVIQGASLRAVWTRQFHRILGTALGLVLTTAILSLPLEPWSIAAVMMTLTFFIEIAIVRHYAFAAILITPLTVLLADAAILGHGHGLPTGLIAARFVDICLGSVLGLAGAVVLYSPRCRTVVGDAARRFTRRLARSAP
jgi:uncharacterized membrane protein YccC